MFHIERERVVHRGNGWYIEREYDICRSGLYVEKESNIYFIDLELTTHNRVHLARVMKKIRTMPEVQRVSRHSQSRH